MDSFADCVCQPKVYTAYTQTEYKINLFLIELNKFDR